MNKALSLLLSLLVCFSTADLLAAKDKKKKSTRKANPRVSAYLSQDREQGGDVTHNINITILNGEGTSGTVYAIYKVKGSSGKYTCLTKTFGESKKGKKSKKSKKSKTKNKKSDIGKKALNEMVAVMGKNKKDKDKDKNKISKKSSSFSFPHTTSVEGVASAAGNSEDGADNSSAPTSAEASFIDYLVVLKTGSTVISQTSSNSIWASIAKTFNPAPGSIFNSKGEPSGSDSAGSGFEENSDAWETGKSILQDRLREEQNDRIREELKEQNKKE